MCEMPQCEGESYVDAQLSVRNAVVHVFGDDSGVVED